MPICVEAICASDVTSSTPTAAAILESLLESLNVIDAKRFRHAGIRPEILGLHRYFDAAA